MAKVTVTAAATPLFAAPAGQGQYSVLLRNLDATDIVALGKVDTAFVDGYQLAANGGQFGPILIAGGETLYGICSAGLSADVIVLSFLSFREL
jgi:hypothetical protein